MISTSIASLYFIINYTTINIASEPLPISLTSTILAGTTAIASIILYFWHPKKKVFFVSLVIYILMLATSVSLIADSGTDTLSPFVSLWILLVFFAGLFGAWGLVPIVLGAGVYAAWRYITVGLDSHETTLIIFSSLLPLIVSFIVWHAKSNHDDNFEEKAYRNLENELSEVANKSEVVINAIGDGVVAIDNQGIIRLINPAAQSIIGWGKQDALALNYKSILQLVNSKNEPLDTTNDPIQQALNLNQQIRSSLNIMTNSGKNLNISLVVSPVGEVGSGVIVVFRDVTKEKAEEREQAEFISTASHEMRTPVASIEGYLGLALNPQTSQIDDRARDFIAKAQASAKHLGHLFQDLLDVSKADDGRINNNPHVIDIVTFTYEIVQGLEPKATEKGLKLTYKPMSGTVREKHITPVYFVNLDNDHIREIINNLVENAIKYTIQGEIIVDISGNDDHVVISVKDSGIGIPAEDMSHLFQKFYRVDNKDTREIGGTGLGLYLCRRLAEIMGGRIWAESVYGNGSTFFVELPRVSNQEASLLKEQEEFKIQQEAARLAMSQPQQPVSNVMQPQQTTGPVLNQPLSSQQAQPKYAPASQAQMQQPVQQPQSGPTVYNRPNPTPMTAPTAPVPQPAKSVPRGQALTPEQIAAYVARQRELAKQQSIQQQANSRQQSVAMPGREVRQ